MRGFVAIELSEELHQQITSVQGQLREITRKASITKPENIHLTLRFLGEISKESAADFLCELKRIRRAPFVIELERVGSFHRKGEDLVWLGIKPAAELDELASEILRIPLVGSERDRRSFRPHITIARRVRFGDPLDFERLMVHPVSMQVRQFTFFESRLRARGAEHIPVDSVKLM